MESNLVGMIYDDADVLSVTDENCRKKWYSIILEKGLDPAEQYLSEKNIKYKKLFVLKLVEDNYILIPWSEKETQYKDSKTPVKLAYRKRGFSGMDTAHLYVFPGLEVKIPIKELEQYNVYLTATRYLLGDVEKICSNI